MQLTSEKGHLSGFWSEKRAQAICLAAIIMRYIVRHLSHDALHDYIFNLRANTTST